MITDKLIDAFLASIEALLTLLPAWEWPARTVVGTIAFAGQANRIFPVATLAALFALTLTLLLVMRGWDAAVWVYHQFWGSS